MTRRRHAPPWTSPAERLAVLEDLVVRLRESAEHGTVVVEGLRDVSALERLGIGGQHVTLHRGLPIEAVIEELSHCPPPVILLLDWDRKGGQLTARVHDGLRARLEVDVESRRRLAQTCQCRAVEDVPAELTALRSA